ncbi:MAG TPA: TlyA family RNA methyltransferase [Ktedonobacterales bacterium]|nr:TlyA family RNA methyltransferase [Ktedonobacterales bacterium]
MPHDPPAPPGNPGNPGKKHARARLDAAVLAAGLAPSRERARALIMAGAVRVAGRLVDKPGTLVAPDAAITLAGLSPELRYASRGGLKLERALDEFVLDPSGLVALDVGASTGGFTDVLLTRGAARVYAVDVGRGQLDWRLRSDPRVVVMERTNIRHLAALPEPVACVVIDVSFISLRLVLPAVARLAADGAWMVALVKPQFEAGRAEADRGAGVIADPDVHRTVLHGLGAWLAGWNAAGERAIVPRGLIPSPITGRDGNREYLLELRVAPAGAPVAALDSAAIERAVAGAFAARAEPHT